MLCVRLLADEFATSWANAPIPISEILSSAARIDAAEVRRDHGGGAVSQQRLNDPAPPPGVDGNLSQIHGGGVSNPPPRFNQVNQIHSAHGGGSQLQFQSPPFSGSKPKRFVFGRRDLLSPINLDQQFQFQSPFPIGSAPFGQPMTQAPVGQPSSTIAPFGHSQLQAPVGQQSAFMPVSDHGLAPFGQPQMLAPRLLKTTGHSIIWLETKQLPHQTNRASHSRTWRRQLGKPSAFSPSIPIGSQSLVPAMTTLHALRTGRDWRC